MTTRAGKTKTSLSHHGVAVAIAGALTAALASGCGAECGLPPRVDLQPNCAYAPDGGLSSRITERFFFTETQRPTPSADWGCHFETDGNQLFFVVDGEVCWHAPQADVAYDDPKWVSVSCTPPVGDWFMASGQRTLKVTVTDAGIRCEN